MCNCNMRQNEVSSLSGAEQQPRVPVNLEAEILPVTCKEKMGLLIKRKLERGRLHGLL